jgi:hypothetical protein
MLGLAWRVPAVMIAAMKRYRRRKCKYCGKLYQVNPRRRDLQRYCRETACQKASHAASQRRWLAKPENRDHFCGPENIDRVQAWRKAHPGYWRRRNKRPIALQDVILTQPVDVQEDKTDLMQGALQDVISSQHALLVGVISTLTGSTLQDEIGQSMRLFQTRGALILGKVPGMQSQRGENRGRETGVVSGSGAKGARAIQLGGSEAGAP